MRKVFYILLFTASVIYCQAQALKIDDVKKQIQSTWLTHGDSICELVVTADSITTFRFRQGGVTGCTYKLSTSPCTKVIKFPASTGIYISENYKTETLCCALDELTPTTLSIIYPSGVRVVYTNESYFIKKGQH